MGPGLMGLPDLNHFLSITSCRQIIVTFTHKSRHKDTRMTTKYHFQTISKQEKKITKPFSIVQFMTVEDFPNQPEYSFLLRSRLKLRIFVILIFLAPMLTGIQPAMHMWGLRKLGSSRLSGSVGRRLLSRSGS